MRFEAVMVTVMELNDSIFNDANCFIRVWEIAQNFWEEIFWKTLIWKTCKGWKNNI